jgi:hypothetical protein
MPEGKGKPSDFAIVLATALYGDQPVIADEVRGQLKVFGFQCSTQQVAAWLNRIARKELPPIEVDVEYPLHSVAAYRVTQWGRTELWNGGLENLGMTLSGKESPHA